MSRKPSDRLLKALATVYSVARTELTPAAAELVANHLAAYPEAAVLTALDRCVVELRGQLCLADIIERIPGQHPGVEQAWAIVAKGLNDESVTLVQTHEMARAFGVALGLQDDPIAARMAFKAEYQNQVAVARQQGHLPVWFVSTGSDATARDGPVMEAVRDGRLPLDYASQFLLEEQRGELQQLLDGENPIRALPR